MNYFKIRLYSIILILAYSTLSFSQQFEKQFDQMMSEQFTQNEPGATAIVAIKGKIVYHKAFGMANMELGVKMRPDMVLEIGSITKQFTAVSILMLMEQGKLSLDDDITKFIQDYPSHGHHISIHHLLTHTSGIKSYTSMEKWAPIWRNDFEPAAFIDTFKNAPMDFAPGEAFKYNNSGYFLLGYIIEKASGQTYEEFVETNIFKALGMKSSYYGSKSEIIKNRASGYEEDVTFLNAEYLSMTQPYAAGSLMSTVEDLFIWNRAIRANKLIKKESIALAFTNHTLNNGEQINYGYGWGFNDISGSRTIEHSGGIFGYVTNSIYLPSEDVFVAIFVNCNCKSPIKISTKMAAIAIGKPYPGKEDVISVNIKNLEKFVGVYDFADSSSRIITIEDNQLISQRIGSSKFKLLPLKNNTFYYEEGFATIQFIEDGNVIKVVFIDRGVNKEGIKTDKAIPEHTEIELDPAELEPFIGVYTLNDGFALTISLEDNKLMSQATGQNKLQIFPESPTKFFLKVVDAQIEFIESENGDYEALILYQNGQEMKFVRKE